MRKKQIAVNVQRVWDITGYPNYFFDANGELYRFNARGEVIPLNRAVNRYTQGYVLKSRFYSLSQLRLLLRRHRVLYGQPWRCGWLIFKDWRAGSRLPTASALI